MSALGAQGIGRIANQYYVPQSAEDLKEYWDMNYWFYHQLRSIVKTTTGKEIVDRHFNDRNCLAILSELTADAQVSPAGRLESIKLLEWLTNVRYNPTQGKAEDFAVLVNTTFDTYNETVPDKDDKIPESQKKAMLQRVFHNVTSLRSVATREVENIAMFGESGCYKASIPDIVSLLHVLVLTNRIPPNPSTSRDLN
jgi:hypothetical protein